MLFDTAEEAENYKTNMITTSKRLKDRYKLLKINNPNKIKKFIHTNFQKHITELTMMENDDWYLNVVQVLVK